MKIKFKNESLTLVGISLGSIAPDFRVISQKIEIVKLSDFKDKIKIITSFPSLDTPVCDLQVKEFNKIATNLSDKVVIIGISCDLPFAQKRFCEMNEIRNVFVFSDYKFHSFGINFGVLIKELRLLARTIFILDQDNNIRYSEIVEELTQQPNYEKALISLEEVVKSKEKKWEEIKCCRWKKEEKFFSLEFPIKKEGDLDILLRIFSLLKEERNIVFDFCFTYDNYIKVSIPIQNFNIEIGNVFERIIY
ncbi:MAG: thiol peroxidase [bacterium]|nr:thiol peroxidase [bacterium]MDW8164187.1 thiol peroxidase [Candidatus Omnitrophota bacterium]